MRRLEELLRQMCQASKAIGNTELENKFAEGNFNDTCTMYHRKTRMLTVKKRVLLFPISSFYNL